MARDGICAVFTTLVVIVILSSCITAQPPSADDIIQKDRINRQVAVKAGYAVATKPKWGFFGTIFNLIVQQVNDTKSAYNQVSDLVNGQFANENTVSTTSAPNSNGTTETPKITRTEFLKILERNLIGLARLRNLEWREARKDSAANLRAYKEEINRGKFTRNGR